MKKTLKIVTATALLLIMLLGFASCTSGGDIKDEYGHDEFDAIALAESAVKEKLKAPSSADFSPFKETTVTCDASTWTVSGWVDAENSFGAKIRNEYRVVFTFSSEDRYTLESCNIN